MYDVAHIFLRWLRVQILCERHVEADILCESNLGVIEKIVTLPEGKFW